MKKRLLTGTILGWICANPVFALGLRPTETPVPSVPKPLILPLKERIKDSTRYSLPKPPHKYPNGTIMDLTNDEENSPQGPAVRNLNDSQVLPQIPQVNKEDNHGGKYYWHPFQGWNYVHYRDGDRQWYGWRTGETFHWILWRDGRFWWYDHYAERWLYFDRGYWWWQGPKAANQIQVFMEDGHFHVCDTNGVLGDDLMQTGTEEAVTDPVAKPSPNPTPGAKHGGRHGGHGGMGGGTNSLPPPSGGMSGD